MSPTPNVFDPLLARLVVMLSVSIFWMHYTVVGIFLGLAAYVATRTRWAKRRRMKCNGLDVEPSPSIIGRLVAYPSLMLSIPAYRVDYILMTMFLGLVFCVVMIGIMRRARRIRAGFTSVHK